MSEGSPTERFGPYIVYEQLGVGGMAQVHRAVAADSDVRRPVALKRMLSHIAGKEEMVKSFVREARLASYLRHENVPQTYDLGKVGDIYFIVMELITGRNLREVLRHCAATTGPMPIPVALNILNQICDALDYAHNLCDETGQPLGIIHRDVSPSNVIVSDSGVVKLIDFGIAKASAAGMQTMSGTLKGKFAYMAPEYLAGQIDARADLFAVGVIAHELLTNRPLFSGRDDTHTLTRVRDMPIDPPSKKNPQVPPEIDDVVMTALARDPDRRWQHATALRNALTTLTRRLGLIAINAQVIQWLDWAFAHRAPPRPSLETDTETDAEPITEPSSGSTEPRTVELSRSGMSGRITLVMRDGDPEPPTTAPLGTPAYVPAQHPLPTGLAAAEPSSPADAPRATASAGVPAMARPSIWDPAPRPSSPSQAPPLAAQPAPAHRPSSPSQAPPLAAQPALAPRPSSPAQAPPLAAQPAHRPSSPSQAPPLAAQPAPPAQPGSYPAPLVPSLSSAPFAAPRPAWPAPASGMPPAPAIAGSQPAGVQRELAQRVSAPAITPEPPARRRRFVTVLLVMLAAAAAAATVYFVLPLLT